MNTILKILIVIFLILPASALAATAVVEVEVGSENVNALEGTLVLPKNMNVNEIQTGNSSITVWISSPKQVGNKITFGGITPGGFTGSQPVFSINGNFEVQDLNEVKFMSVNALKNDGSGTRVAVEMSLSLVPFRADSELPEEFTPTIANDPNLFAGKYFLVFATQDKGSGIDLYEVREGRWGWFSEAESPYELRGQQLDKDIYVKAIDNAGNERVVVIPAQIRSAWWEWYGLFVIIIVIVLVAFSYKKK